MDGQTGMHADRHTDRLAGRQAGRQTGTQRDRQTSRQTENLDWFNDFSLNSRQSDSYKENCGKINKYRTS